MSIRSMLRSTATIETPTFAATTYSSGGAVTYANLYIGVDCDIQPVRPITGRETIALGREQAYQTHNMYCVATDVPLVAASDKVIFGTREFEIVGVRDTDSVSRLMVLDLLERVGVKVD